MALVPKDGEMLTSRQAAQFLRRDVRTIARWAESGRLSPSMRLPGKTGAMLFHREDVERVADELAAEQQEEVEAPA